MGLEVLGILLRKMPGMCQGAEETTGLFLGLVESKEHVVRAPCPFFCGGGLVRALQGL